MKHYIRYQTLMIPNKLKVDVRITLDDTRSPSFTTTRDASKSTILNLFPILSITLIKTVDENTKKSSWSPSDSLPINKASMSKFITELVGIQKDLRIVELYHYTNDRRLEVNPTLSEKIRRVFVISNITIELSAVVIINDNNEQVEGIKMKFNNELSSVLLTLDELDSLVYTVKTIDIDNIAFMLYQSYQNNDSTNPSTGTSDESTFPRNNVDIVPKRIE